MVETERRLVTKGTYRRHHDRAMVTVRVGKGPNRVAEMLFENMVSSADFFMDGFRASSSEDRVSM